MYDHLRVGDHGPAVELLQHVLQSLRYDPGSVDGWYGPRTDAAVEQYKKDRGLDDLEQGCGDYTWNSLHGAAGNLEGMRTTANTDRYVADVYGTFNSSMTPEDLIHHLEQAVNIELAAAGVPYVKCVLDPKTPPDAVFDQALWETQIAPAPFQPDAMAKLTPDEQAYHAGVVYHECRHAEQYWEVARLLAGLHGMDGAAVHKAIDIRMDVATQAAADPIYQCTLGNGPIFDWYRSIYGPDAAQSDAIQTSLDDPDPKKARWSDYRTKIPEEADAWDTEGAVHSGWRNYSTGGATVSLPVLHAGSSVADQVAYLQELLSWHGYPTARDGSFGAGTAAAVAAFQTAHSLPPDGIVGPSTWRKLLP